MECISCCRPRLNLTLNISPYVGTDDSRWPSLSRVTAFASTTKHLTVCTRRQTCQRSLIDIQMYACTSSKFDHPYWEEGIVGLSTVKVFRHKWHTPTYTKACIRTLPGKAPALEVAAVTHSAFEANLRSKMLSAKPLATPSTEFSSAVVRDPGFPQPVSDVSRAGRGQRDGPCQKNTSSCTTGREHCGSSDGEKKRGSQNTAAGLHWGLCCRSAQIYF